MSFEDFFLFFRSPLWKNIEAVLKPTSIILIFFFLYIIVWALRNSSWLYWYATADFQDFKKGQTVSPQTIFQKKWAKIKKRIESRNEANWKLAVIEGEEIIEKTLSDMGYEGEGIREKLKDVDQNIIPNLPDLISSYDIFLNILADPDYKLTHDKAIKTISTFEEFLKEFELM